MIAAGCDDAPVIEFSSEQNSVSDASISGEELNATENIALENICMEVSGHVADAVSQEESNGIGGGLPAVLNPSTVPLTADEGLDGSPDSKCQQLQMEEISTEDFQSGFGSEKSMAHQLDQVEPSGEVNTVDSSLAVMDMCNTEQHDFPSKMEGNPSTVLLSDNDLDESSDREYQQLQREEMSSEDIQTALDSEKLMAHQLDAVESSEKISTLGVMEMSNTEQHCAPKTAGSAHVETSVGGCVMSYEISPLPDPTEKKVSIGFPVSPFASDSVSGQFPRPTLSTPVKSSSKKQTTMQKLTHVADENNKENIGKSERGNDKVKKVKNIIDADSLKDISLRQLTKMVKELEISKNRKKSEVGLKFSCAFSTYILLLVHIFF